MRCCPVCQHTFSNDVITCTFDGSLLSEKDLLIGTTFQGRYDIELCLGEGGMGKVYKAEDLTLRRTVAVKLIHDSVTNDDTLVQRFIREARLLSLIHHKNVASVYSCSSDLDGQPYLVLEYVDGPDIWTALESGRLESGEIILVLRQVAQALAHCHKNEILHRDIKPANILVQFEEKGPVAKLVDFGLAKAAVTQSAPGEQAQKLTQTGFIVGTLNYLAPEVWRGHPATIRSDIYSFGRTIEDLLSHFPTLPRSLKDVSDRCAVLDEEERLPDFEAVDDLLSSSTQRPGSKSLKQAMIALLAIPVMFAAMCIFVANNSYVLNAKGKQSETGFDTATEKSVKYLRGDIQSLLRNHLPRQALMQAERLVEINNSMESRDLLGLCYLELRDPLCILEFEKVYASAPGNNAASMRLLEAYLLFDRIDDAFKLCSAIGIADNVQSTDQYAKRFFYSALSKARDGQVMDGYLDFQQGVRLLAKCREPHNLFVGQQCDVYLAMLQAEHRKAELNAMKNILVSIKFERLSASERNFKVAPSLNKLP